jgi:hypothetical protein
MANGHEITCGGYVSLLADTTLARDRLGGRRHRIRRPGVRGRRARGERRGTPPDGSGICDVTSGAATT